MPFTMFNLAEAAEYLSLRADALEELARRGEIPSERQGGRVVFRHWEIDEWASKRMLEMGDEGVADYHRRTLEETPLMSSLAGADRMWPGLTCRTKASVIREMCDRADGTGLVCDKEDLRKSLEAREEMCPTALEGGLALLHPRHHEPYMFVESFVALGRTVGEVPFGAPDGTTTDLFFLVCCQNDRLHLHVLARLCLMCHKTNLLPGLRETDNPREMMSLLEESEQEILRGVGKGGKPV